MPTIHAELLAVNEDFAGYTTYVFRNLESEDIYTKYIMCTRFPNWECRILNVGDRGYLSFKENIAGVDKWYNPSNNTMNYYNYSCVQFIKFVDECPIKKEIIL